MNLSLLGPPLVVDTIGYPARSRTRGRGSEIRLALGASVGSDIRTAVARAITTSMRQAALKMIDPGAFGRIVIE